MDEILFLQIFIVLCFVALIIVLFFEKADYITYSVIIIIIAAIVTTVILPEETGNLTFFILKIDWPVIIFLVGMFLIVEILDDKNIFQEISRRLVERYKKNLRKLFYLICIVSTLVATVLEDLSVAIIFGPIIVIACRQLKINAAPFLLGMTICINLASALFPFGSAEDVLIVSSLNIDFLWFVRKLGPYFIMATALTLFLLDKFMLQKAIQEGRIRMKQEEAEKLEHEVITEKITITTVDGEEIISSIDPEQDDPVDETFYHTTPVKDHKLSEYRVDNKTLYRNLGALGVFVLLLIVIREIYLGCLISAIIFVVINPVKGEDGKSRPALSYYLRKVDLKLVYFFICLFILVGLMEANGTILLLEKTIANFSFDSEFLLCLIILIITSILSGFMDNAPVTVIFLPIIQILINLPVFRTGPIIVAFILGINLGGNFLPQGSACDMMTLEIARQNNVGLTYKRLFKIGGLFALIHILIGIAYLALLIYVFPGWY